MAFVLKICLTNPCTTDGHRVRFADTSGQYDVLNNPTGYGVPGGPSSPSDFDTYELKLWKPGQLTSEAPFIVIDLMDTLPPPDTDGHYTWSFGASDLGLAEVVSGVWYAYVTVKSSIIPTPGKWTANAAGEFTGQVSDMVNKMMNGVDPLCGCGCGCHDPLGLYALWLATKCGGASSRPQFEKNVKYLLYHIPNCC